MKNSGEIYAEFTLIKIKASLTHEPLSEGQFESIRKVLLATQRDQSHAVDVRLFIPVFFRSYYILLFAGRDRRRSTLELNRVRLIRTFHRVIRIINLSTLTVLSFLLAGLMFWGLYSVKSAVGIDLIPGFHLSEWVVSVMRGLSEVAQ